MPVFIAGLMKKHGEVLLVHGNSIETGEENWYSFDEDLLPILERDMFKAIEPNIRSAQLLSWDVLSNCPECAFVEEEYVRADNDDLTRDALILKTAVLQKETLRLKGVLGELLAVLNGDGGHYAAQHGEKAAVERGLQRFYEMKGRLGE